VDLGLVAGIVNLNRSVVLCKSLKQVVHSHSRLPPEAAWQLSEDIKSEWWQANERRFTPEGTE
jgi:hypothetical protein